MTSFKHQEEVIAIFSSDMLGKEKFEHVATEKICGKKGRQDEMRQR